MSPRPLWVSWRVSSKRRRRERDSRVGGHTAVQSLTKTEVGGLPLSSFQDESSLELWRSTAL